MRNNNKLLIILMTGLLFLVPKRSIGQSIPTTEIAICGDVVPAELRQANASFDIFYEIETDSKGTAAKVTKLKNEIFADVALVSCLRKWSLPITNAKVKLALRWDHGKGWTRFSISIPGHPTRHIKIEPGWPF